MSKIYICKTEDEKREMVVLAITAEPMGKDLYFMDLAYVNDSINKAEMLRAIPIKYMTLDDLDRAVSNPNYVGFNINNFKSIVKDMTPSHKP